MIGLSGVGSVRRKNGQRLTVSTFGTIAYGRAIVYNTDGTVNREVALTPAEYAALGSSGRPAGVAANERWIAFGRSIDLGGVEVQGTSLLMLHRRHVANGITREAFLLVGPGEWTGTVPAITVNEGILLTLPSDLRPVSVLDGIVVS